MRSRTISGYWVILGKIVSTGHHYCQSLEAFTRLFRPCFFFPFLLPCWSQGAEHRAGEGRRDTEVSFKEAAVCYSRRRAAPQNWGPTWRPAANSSVFPPHCGKRATSNTMHKAQEVGCNLFSHYAPIFCSALCWVIFVCSVQSCWSLVASCSGIPLPSTSCGWWTFLSSCPKRRGPRSWSRLIIPSLLRCLRTHTCCTRSHTR